MNETCQQPVPKLWIVHVEIMFTHHVGVLMNRKNKLAVNGSF